MTQMIVKVLVVAVTLLLAAKFIPGIEISSLYIAVISAIVIGLINLLIRPVLFILTLPLTIITLGIFAFVLNALMIMFAASFVEGFSVDGFLPALILSFLVSLAGSLSDHLFAE